MNKISSTVATVALCGVLAGCTVNVSTPQPPTTERSTPTSRQAPGTTPATAATTETGETATTADNGALLTAVSTATDALGGGTLSKAESDFHDTMWEVRAIAEDGHERKVHTSADGRSVSIAVEDEDDDVSHRAENRRHADAAHVGLVDAVAKVTEVQPGAVTEIRLDDSHGRVVWRASIDGADGLEHEVRIDAGTADLVSDEIDR